MSEIRLSFWKQKEIDSSINTWKDLGISNGDIDKFLKDILEQKEFSKIVGSATIKTGKKTDKKRIRKIVKYELV